MATQLNDDFESEKQLRQLFGLVFVIVFMIVLVIVFMFVHVNCTKSMIPQIRIMDGSGSNFLPSFLPSIHFSCHAILLLFTVSEVGVVKWNVLFVTIRGDGLSDTLRSNSCRRR